LPPAPAFEQPHVNLAALLTKLSPSTEDVADQERRREPEICGRYVQIFSQAPELGRGGCADRVSLTRAFATLEFVVRLPIDQEQ
jgi:hypothetical protein